MPHLLTHGLRFRNLSQCTFPQFYQLFPRQVLPSTRPTSRTGGSRRRRRYRRITLHLTATLCCLVCGLLYRLPTPFRHLFALPW